MQRVFFSQKFQTNYFVLIVLSLSINQVLSLKDLPDYFPRCSLKDPELNKCLLKATEQVRPFLQKGVPELNWPPISPLFIPEVNLQNNNRDNLDYRMVARNVSLYGLDKYEFIKFDFDYDKLVFDIETLMPQVYLIGDAELDTKLLTINLKTTGKLSANISQSIGHLIQKVQMTKRKGVEYMNIVSTSTKIRIGKVLFYKFESHDLRDNPILAEAANKVIEDNMDVFTEEITPVVENLMSTIFSNIFFKTLVKIPFNKLYP